MAGAQRNRFDSVRTLSDVRTERSMIHRSWANIKTFFLDIWLDLLLLVALGGVIIAVWVQGPAFTRYFPIPPASSSTSVAELNRDISYPYVDPVFSSAVVAVICIIIPIVVIILGQIFVRSFDDAAYGLLGLCYSLVSGTLFQVILKKVIGGFRPHFLSVCEPATFEELQAEGITGIGFDNMYFYPDDACRGPSLARIHNAMETYPSGHSEIAFAALFYLSIYLYAHLHITGISKRPKYWKMVAVGAPIWFATYVAGTVVLGYHHHVGDAFAGSLIGVLVASLGYRMVFHSISDRRSNYIPRVRGGAHQEGEKITNDKALRMTASNQSPSLTPERNGNTNGDLLPR